MKNIIPFKFLVFIRSSYFIKDPMAYAFPSVYLSICLSIYPSLPTTYPKSHWQYEPEESQPGLSAEAHASRRNTFPGCYQKTISIYLIKFFELYFVAATISRIWRCEIIWLLALKEVLNPATVRSPHIEISLLPWVVDLRWWMFGIKIHVADFFNFNVLFNLIYLKYYYFNIFNVKFINKIFYILFSY